MGDLTQDELKRVLHYEETSGDFIWKVSAGRAKKGSIARTLCRGYIRIKVSGKLHFAHRLAWLYIHGQLPKKCIDHINGDKSDNRIANLREATNSQNSSNRKSDKNSTSQYVGVCWSTNANKWLVQVTKNGEIKYLGLFSDEVEAAKARDKAALELHGEFAKLNFPQNHKQQVAEKISRQLL